MQGDGASFSAVASPRNDVSLRAAWADPATASPSEVWVVGITTPDEGVGEQYIAHANRSCLGH